MTEDHGQELALARGRDAVLALETLGVIVELVGSVVWGRFHAASDVDFLIVDRAGASDGLIFETIASRLGAIPFDIIFLDNLRPAARDLILRQRDEHGRPPIGHHRRVP